jgi:hypothetical protein
MFDLHLITRIKSTSSSKAEEELWGRPVNRASPPRGSRSPRGRHPVSDRHPPTMHQRTCLPLLYCILFRVCFESRIGTEVKPGLTSGYDATT